MKNSTLKKFFCNIKTSIEYYLHLTDINSIHVLNQLLYFRHLIDAAAKSDKAEEEQNGDNPHK